MVWGLVAQGGRTVAARVLLAARSKEAQRVAIYKATEAATVFAMTVTLIVAGRKLLLKFKSLLFDNGDGNLTTEEKGEAVGALYASDDDRYFVTPDGNNWTEVSNG